MVLASHGRGAIVKVIIETALLDDAQKVLACRLAQDAGADFVKTSTGFSKAGRHGGRHCADAPRGGLDGREGIRRHPHAGGSQSDGRGGSDPGGRERERAHHGRDGRGG